MTKHTKPPMIDISGDWNSRTTIDQKYPSKVTVFEDVVTENHYSGEGFVSLIRHRDGNRFVLEGRGLVEREWHSYYAFYEIINKNKIVGEYYIEGPSDPRCMPKQTDTWTR